MNAAIFPDQASALAVAAQVDAALGMPIAGRDIGSGAHAPPSQSVTTTYAQPFKHPTLGQWAYLCDAVTQPHMTGPVLATAKALDATWFPAPTLGTATVG